MKGKSLPIGIENFEEMIERGYYYVDKTLLIKDLLDINSKVNLFTRPRRFGKTLNMSMIQYFFEDTGKDNSHIFQNLDIANQGEQYLSHMGKYPVIFVKLKVGKQPNFEYAHHLIKDELRGEFIRHDYLRESDKIKKGYKEDFERILENTAEDEEYQTCLKLLSECLEQHHGEKTIILIDEYDVPLENAYFAGFYDEMTGFIRSLFESALKTNNALHMAVMTGCLRISKESIFTGLNNLKIISVLTEDFGEYFGFSEDEVQDALEYYGLKDKEEEVRRWYNGYLFGNSNVYNPWSVINYINEMYRNHDQFPTPYWSNTSANNIVRTLIDMAQPPDKVQIDHLIMGGTIEKPVYEDITYDEVAKDTNHLWNFLFFTGYLKKTSERLEGREKYLTLKIPNEEVLFIYERKIRAWFEEGIKVKAKDLGPMYEAIFTQNVDVFERELNKLLYETVSFYDNYEAFYHGFLLGVLLGMKTYIVKSNREMGTGRTDIYVRHPSIRGEAVIFELKVAKRPKELSTKCHEALAQIDEKGYEHDLREEGYENIIKYGVAFYRKDCMIESQ